MVRELAREAVEKPAKNPKKNRNARSGPKDQSPRKSAKPETTNLSPFHPGKPLAIWTSLVSAQEMTSFYERNHGDRPEGLTLMSLDDLAFLDRHELEAYELFFMGYYDCDSIPRRALQNLTRLSRQKKLQSSTPLSIFHCGNSTSGKGRRWRRVIGELSQNCRVMVNHGREDFSGCRISRLVSNW